jgi:hypothetical protein
VPIQAFIDDSGSKGQGDTFVLAGFIGRAEDWAAFADRWQAALERPPAIPRFKFWEFAHGEGSFARFSEAERNKKVSELVAAMAGGCFTRISVALDLPAFQEWSGTGWAGFEISHPYCFVFQLIIAAVAYTLLDRRHSEPFEILFDEQLALGSRAKRWYPVIRELCMGAEIQALLPPEPIFRRDEEFVALQAADLYAGLVRSGKGEKDATREAILSPLLPILSGLKVTHAVEMRVQASFVASRWESVCNAAGLAAADAFIPTMERLKKNLADIGGDPISEQRLAPMFAAVERAIANGAVAAIDNSDGFGWLRRELAEVTAISARSETVGQAFLSRQGTSPKIPIDEKLLRTVALLDEDGLDAYRQKVVKRHKKAARGAARRKRRRR